MMRLIFITIERKYSIFCGANLCKIGFPKCFERRKQLDAPKAERKQHKMKPLATPNNAPLNKFIKTDPGIAKDCLYK